jgi:hypothetical protein
VLTPAGSGGHQARGQARSQARLAVLALTAAAAAAAVLAGCGAPGSGPGASRNAGGARKSAAAHPAPRAAARSGSPASAAGTATAPARGHSGNGAGTVGVVASGPRTSCTSVVHIGDSTSDGLVLPAYQPDAALRIAAQYRRVGVTRFIPEVSGARSIYETWHGFPNGYTVAHRLISQGYRGCWVMALGTNDAADVAVGSAMSMAARIQEMMKLFNGAPVLWINVVSLLSSGPYAESHMQEWDRALLRACPDYPNMRVYDWAAVARSSWFIPDGIHYTPPGYAVRSRDIANALAAGFPAEQAAPPSRPDVADLSSWQAAVRQSCLVR